MDIRKLRKVICVLLALLLLAGCGKQTAGGETNPVAATEATEDTAQTETTQQTAAATETTAATDSTETTAETQEDPASFGQLEDGAYTNNYIGIGCKMTDGWQIYDVQQLQELSSDALQMLENGNISDALESYEQIYDMLMEDSTGKHSVNVLYTRLSANDHFVYATMDEAQLVESILGDQRDLLIAGYASEGYQVQKLEKQTVTFLGQSRTALYLEVTLNGETSYILQLFDYWLGQYGVTVTFHSAGENKLQDMLSMFYQV